MRSEEAGRDCQGKNYFGRFLVVLAFGPSMPLYKPAVT